jgi:hypothetical protein
VTPDTLCCSLQAKSCSGPNLTGLSFGALQAWATVRLSRSHAVSEPITWNGSSAVPDEAGLLLSEGALFWNVTLREVGRLDEVFLSVADEEQALTAAAFLVDDSSNLLEVSPWLSLSTMYCRLNLHCAAVEARAQRTGEATLLSANCDA